MSKSDRSARNRHDRRVYALCLLVFPLMLASGIVYSVLSLYFAELGASRSQIGLIYACGSAVGAVSSPFVGRLADRVGKKPVLLGATGLFALVFLLYGMCGAVKALFPVQALEGLAWATLTASALSLLADLVPPERRGEAMGIYNATWYVGWIVGPLSGGFLAQHLGFRTTFLICAGLIVAGTVAGAGLLRRL